ncbi:MAG: hypothetical protein FJ320_07155 [SAR202 cluster bacterium]|nr:hypothetical protein [SAR202 cluster bacterium]
MKTLRTLRGRKLAPISWLPLLAALLGVALAAPTASAADPEDRVRQILDDAATNGTVGVYLKEVNGSVIAANNESFIFEPASTIKALIHFHAMRQVQDGAVIDGDVVTLATQVPWFAGPANYNNSPPPGTSCPDVSTLPGTDTLQNGLQQMMGPSDNRWTQAMRDFFGDASINNTRDTFDMDDTALNHLIGCGANALANPNQLTLVDGGKMYESVATGFLDNANRASAFSLMTQDNGTFNGIIDTEAAGMSLSAASIASFKSQRQSANKAGSYTLSDGENRTVAGWAQVPWKDTVTCETEIQEYVYGAFIHKADSIDGGFMGIRPAGVELFREEIRAALESWAACEADLQITSTTMVDAPDEIPVNTPVQVTVRVAMRNNGPADVIDGKLVRVASASPDCQIAPEDASEIVPAMAQGNLVVVERNLIIECSQPSFHGFEIASEINSANPNVVEPNLSNNDGVASLDLAVIAQADLAVVGWDFSELDSAELGEILVGQPFVFSTTKTLHNFGDTVNDLYSDPVDANVERSMVIPEGIKGSIHVGAQEAPATIVIDKTGEPQVVLNNQPAGTVVEAEGPATITVQFKALDLAVSVDREIAEVFDFECLEPSQHELKFTNSIAAVDQHVEDPNASNNSVEVVRVIECVTPVAINFRPGNDKNFINPNSNQKFPVAILTTSAGEYGLPIAFNATKVDFATTRFGTQETLNNGGGSSPSPAKDFVKDTHELDDKKKDGDLDMVLHFGVSSSGVHKNTTKVCVVGSYLGSDNNWHTFFGCDAVEVKP